MKQSLLSHALLKLFHFNGLFSSPMLRGTRPTVLLKDNLLPIVGSYNRRRAVTVAASKRAATKRRNIAKRSPKR